MIVACYACSFFHAVCSVGTYSDDISNSPCELCPANSEATVTGLSVCPCIQNYYRATDEEASVTCTREFEQALLSTCLSNFYIIIIVMVNEKLANT